MHRQHKFKRLLAILFASVWLSTKTFAQDPVPVPLIGSQTIDDPGMTNNSDPIVSDNGIDPPPDPGIPVDGGLSLLLAAGASYGVGRIKRKREKS